MTNELSGRARTEMAVAAEAAAASFGQVLHGISEQQAAQFTTNSRAILAEREQEFEQFAAGAMQNLESSASASVNRFQERMASQIETSVVEGRNALASEFASMLESFRTDRDAYKSEWAAGLDHSSAEAAAKHQERLQASSDSWVVSSVRRLNEHGQSAVESLISSRRTNPCAIPARRSSKSWRKCCARQNRLRMQPRSLHRRPRNPRRRTSSRRPAIRTPPSRDAATRVQTLVRLLLSHYFANRTRHVFNLFLR